MSSLLLHGPLLGPNGDHGTGHPRPFLEPTVKHIIIMPNWSFTNYAIIGDRKEVKSLYKKMKRLEEMPEPLLPNGFGTSWLGCLVKTLGADPQAVYCRGMWQNLEFSDEGRLTFDVEHAWSRPDEVEDLIRKKYPSLSIFFLEEELGMGIFQTNDACGEYFPETIILDDEQEGSSTGADFRTERDPCRGLDRG